MADKFKLLLNLLKQSFWKMMVGLLLLITIALIVSYFSQGERLSQTAFNNAQRIIIPLKDDNSEWIGMQIEVAPKKDNSLDDLDISSVETEEKDIPSGGSAADLTASIAETPTDKNQESPTTETQVVVSQALTDAASSEEASKQAPVKAEEPIEGTAAAATETPEKTTKTSPYPTGTPLVGAPAEELTEKKNGYKVPRISEDGDKPWKYYAKPFKDNKKPIISIIIKGLGLGRLTTEAAFNLDSHVTLSFSPYAKNAEMWASHARNIGHEVMVDLPQEGKKFPADDPGPYALLNSLDVQTNKDRLYWVMSRIPGFVGFLQHDNPGFQSGPVVGAFTELANRGLFFVESSIARTENLTKQQDSMGLITQLYDRRVDDVLGKENIQRELDLLVKDALKNGHAIGIARPYPLTMELLNEWIQTLNSKGIQLAPVSAIIDREY